MPTNKPSPFLLLMLAAPGCGSEVRVPSDWMFGTFSNQVVGVKSNNTSFEHFEFREDGTFSVFGISKCEENDIKLLNEYSWSRFGDSHVLVGMINGQPYEEWFISLGETCNTLEVDWLHAREPIGSFSLTRGAVCMKNLPPCSEGTSCESCETVWCDEPPPPCTD